MREFKRLGYPAKIGSEYIVAMYPEVEDEMIKIYERSGEKNYFIGQLKQRIKYLEEKKKNCILHRNWFENYKGEDWLYCLIIKDKQNFRMYFVFHNNKAVLLHAFVERRDTSDIRRAKKIAKERYEIIKNIME